MIAPRDVVEAAEALPQGECRGTWQRTAWTCSKSSFAKGRALKIVAEGLGGKGYVSMNIYMLEEGPQLFPCEMPAQRCIDFLQGFCPEASE
ncbi:MAG: hypothetical protein P1U53_12260 [Sulfitobacter sp.]|nr:hypothetical protein [Sulfitobacter sp.]